MCQQLDIYLNSKYTFKCLISKYILCTCLKVWTKVQSMLSNDPTSSTKGDTDKYIYIYNSTCVDNIKSHPTLNNLNWWLIEPVAWLRAGQLASGFSEIWDKYWASQKQTQLNETTPRTRTRTGTAPRTPDRRAAARVPGVRGRGALGTRRL